MVLLSGPCAQAQCDHDQSGHAMACLERMAGVQLASAIQTFFKNRDEMRVHEIVVHGSGTYALHVEMQAGVQAI